ncbi:hypothetical protein QJS66_16445 [Kocuria rhizophila]|nr:hypothetical protein QJS66_16445 [Kocuria rhizophila]
MAIMVGGGLQGALQRAVSGRPGQGCCGRARGAAWRGVAWWPPGVSAAG